MLTAKYSAGYDLNELRDEFVAILQDVPLFYGGTSYNEILKPLVYAILYNVD